MCCRERKFFELPLVARPSSGRTSCSGGVVGGLHEGGVTDKNEMKLTLGGQLIVLSDGERVPGAKRHTVEAIECR
jgi:hypothetical protein